MNNVRIALIVLLPACQTILLSIGMTYPVFYFGILISTLILSDVLFALFFKRGTPKRQILITAFPSGALLLFVGTALAMLETSEMRIALLVLNTLLQSLYAMTLYFALHRPEHFQQRSLWHVTLAVQGASYFAFNVTFFGLLHYAVAPFRILILPFIIITLLFLYHSSLIFFDVVRERWRFVIIGTVILSEFALLLYWLPSLYLSKAFLMSVPHYLFSSMTLNSKDSMDRWKKTTPPFLIAAIMLILVLITLRWR